MLGMDLDRVRLKVESQVWTEWVGVKERCSHCSLP